MTEDRTLFDSLPDDDQTLQCAGDDDAAGSTDRTEPKPVGRPPAGIPHSGTDTSRAAARRISPLASALTARVFHFIASRADNGATDFEVQDGLGLSGDTERPRRWTLQKCGLVRDSGTRRKSPSGRAAIVYVATAEGLSQGRSQAS